MKVHIRPVPREVKSNNGIGRIVHAQYKHLPRFGIELVGPDQVAEVYAGHTQRFDMPRIDCLHCHGMYWTGDPGSGTYNGWHHGINFKIVEAARECVALTVPSEWVALPFRRDMRISPIVIGHGIELGEWKPPRQHKEYVLWNKNRNTDVCDPTPAWELANRGVEVLTTFGISRPTPPTLQIVGFMPANEMHEVIRNAGVYLATTKETFGIGTIEAMACGVPVLGYAWGATPDIVQHGINGWLVRPGDTEALYKGLENVRAHHSEMGEAARAAAQRYDWPAVIEQYARLYHSIVEQKHNEPQGVSIIITCYNYEQFVGEAIASAQQQTISPIEIIVVDDGSTDSSLQVMQRYADDPRVKVIAQRNQGIAAARTAGIRAATQEYLVCLDADDRLEPKFIEVLLPAIQADRSLGIVYSGISLNYPDGGKSVPEDWPPEFKWEGQSTVSNPPSNAIPSACMFRKEMWERAGPHKQEYAPGEDAEFWTRGLSVGFRAKRVTREPLFWYRLHPKSATRRLEYRPIDDRMPWMRDRRYPMAVPLRETIPLIRSYSHPLVSVIIPVGPGHARYVGDALDSLLGQTLREWEVIVVDDTYSVTNGKDGVKSLFRSEFDLSLMRRYPFVTFELSPKDKRGAGNARNAGLHLAQAPLVLFLDADDVLVPNALSEMVKAYVASGGKYVYTDFYALNESGAPQLNRVMEYEQRVWLDNGLHSTTTLLPREWILQAGGFDTVLPGWEEGDLFTRMAIQGYCGTHLSQALLVYREYSGNRKVQSNTQSQEIIQAMRQRYARYMGVGGKAMAACCGGNGETIQFAKSVLSQMPPEVNATDGKAGVAKVRMEYMGNRRGAVTFFGLEGREYQGGNNPLDRYADVHPDDVAKLEHSGQWRKVVIVPAVVRPEAPRGMQWEEQSAVEQPAFPSELEKALLGGAVEMIGTQADPNEVKA